MAGLGAAAAGPDGVLVELHSCQLLIGCPLGTDAALARLGVHFREPTRAVAPGRCAGRRIWMHSS